MTKTMAADRAYIAFVDSPEQTRRHLADEIHPEVKALRAARYRGAVMRGLRRAGWFEKTRKEREREGRKQNRRAGYRWRHKNLREAWLNSLSSE